MTSSILQSLIAESVHLEKQGFTSPQVRMARRAAKDALRHAVIGQDVEKLTDALLAKAQEMARLSKLNDYVAARRRLAIARASIWTPNQTTDAIESARAALAAGLAGLRAKHNIRPALLVRA